jgi:hybrid cluster-associated redox disulfide protein
MQLDSKMTVSELMTAYPSAIAVFIKRKMLCVGCPTETFHTIEDAARIHGITLEHLLKDLRKAIDTQEKSCEV